VIGAFFLVRRNVYESLGGFDERFFVYREDLDFSLRAKQAGWSSYFLRDAHAYHRCGGSSEQIKSIRLFYSVRSRLLYSFKHFSHLEATGLLIGTVFVEPIFRMTWAAKKRSFGEIGQTFGAWLRLYCWIGLYPFRRNAH